MIYGWSAILGKYRKVTENQGTAWHELDNTAIWFESAELYGKSQEFQKASKTISVSVFIAAMKLRLNGNISVVD